MKWRIDGLQIQLQDLMAQQLEMDVVPFQNRFTETHRIDDLFNRGYVLCLDKHTQRRALLKHYSTETAESSEAVIQNMDNFYKLNQIEGICELLAYSRLETELAAVFDFHEKTLGEIVAEACSNSRNSKEGLKRSTMGGQSNRIQFYMQVMTELSKIISTTSQVGIELDDLNRDTVVIANSQAQPVSSSSIKSLSTMKVKVLYDQRDREYDNLLNNITSLRNGNKCYWSADKIATQIFEGNAYDARETEQSVYQLGLLMLDIIYECENSQELNDTETVNSRQQDSLLSTDSPASGPQRKRGYYIINKQNRTVQRQDAIVAFKLNFLARSGSLIVKKIGSSLSKMISQDSSNRMTLDEFNHELDQIWKILRQEAASLPVISSGEISMGNRLSSEDIIIDSLKYSENSLSFNEDFRSLHNDISKKNNSSPYTPKHKKDPHMPLSSTTLTSEAASIQQHITGIHRQEQHQRDPIAAGPSREGQFIRQEMILNQCNSNHPGLIASLRGAIQQLNEMSKVNSSIAQRKQYFDGSHYYGCVDQSQRRSGLGIYLYKAGDIYFGNWKDNALVNGTYLFKNGQSFEGKVKNGKQGKGVYRYLNGNVYEGEWKDDLKEGQGVMLYPSGAKYEGQWVKGKKHGVGTYWYENGLKFVGGFALGKKYGEGEFLFPNGTKVEGFWDNNHLEGQARILYHNGDYYEGNVHMSEKSGQGIYKWNSEDGQIEYKGEFKKDSLQGFAVIKFRTGEVYEGKVKHGKRDGQGTYLYRNGDEFRGEWKNDEKVMGKYIFQGGEIFEGKFRNGQISFGTFHYANGQVYQGEFLNGERHGVGTYADKMGKIVHEGHWDRDQLVKHANI